MLLTLPPHKLELARSLLVAHAEMFCSGWETRSRAAAEEGPEQMREVMLMEKDTKTHSPPALCRERELFFIAFSQYILNLSLV